MAKFLIIATLILCYQMLQLDATISENFQRYIRKKYGDDVLSMVARNDVGSRGSFGGGDHQAGKTTKKIPIIFVHGVMESAGSYIPVAQAFKNYGYSESELYATTYGTAMGMMTYQASLDCQFMKGLRALIKSVVGFTNQKVNVVGYSLGGPVSRKAILGGKCVETGEDLGPPLTKSVNAYLGVAGAQQGCKMCSYVFSTMCNKRNGIGCDSLFYQDINGKIGYEGKKIYVLQSLMDEVVGHIACGKKASEIAGSTKTVTLNGYLHKQMCSALTAKYQYDLLNNRDD